MVSLTKGHIMDREQMLQVMRQAYAARVRGDVDAILNIFAPDAQFKLNAAPSQPLVAFATAGADGMRRALTQLVDAFEFQSCDIIDSVVEGAKAAFRIRFTVCARATGHVTQTESLDLIEFRNGKVSSYTQFFDTALADRLMSQ